MDIFLPIFCDIKAYKNASLLQTTFSMFKNLIQEKT